jgi:hypothetical protein
MLRDFLTAPQLKSEKARHCAKAHLSFWRTSKNQVCGLEARDMV